MRSFLHPVFHAFLAFKTILAVDVGSDIPAQYYFLSPHSSHLDGRFAQVEPISIPETHEALVRTVRRFLSAMREIKVTVWLAHGGLLGWYWGQKVLPWDTDVDVHIHYDDLRFLAAYHNMTVYKDGKDRLSAEYLLDINPNFPERSGAKDPNNVVDARWIDMATGLFVDITAVSDVQRNSEKGEQHLLTKDGHSYRQDAILPLRLSRFEMEEVHIPRNASAILAHEYGQESLEMTLFRGHSFDPDMNQWNVVRPMTRGW